MKTHELTGTALDWAAAVCEGFTDYDPDTETMMPPRKGYGRVNFDEYSFSTDWSLAGEIIEREKIQIKENGHGHWFAKIGKGKWLRGPTPLIAAMRCYVASVLGAEIDVPVELTKGELNNVHSD